MATEDEPDEIERGPKGGRKHTPGRDHDGKSKRRKQKRFRKKAAQKRADRDAAARTRWAEWDRLPPEVQRLRPELRPTDPRPDP